MAGIKLKPLLSASCDLANDKVLPPSHSCTANRTWAPGKVHTIKLKTMLGLIAVLPQQTDRVTLAVYGSDKQMINLRTNVQGGVLNIEGELPFKPSLLDGLLGFRGVDLSFSVPGVRRILFVDGRRIDLSRYIQLVLTVPIGTNVSIGNLIGAIGIGSNLGRLDFSSSFDANVYARSVAVFTGEIRGHNKVQVRRVDNSTAINVSGRGSCVIGSVGGVFNAHASDFGKVHVEGSRSHAMRAEVSGHASIRHGGIVLGETHLWARDTGTIDVRQIKGKIHSRASDLGVITVDSQMCDMHW